MSKLRRLYYSFPVRLVHLHVRNHLVLMVLWLFIILLITGGAGKFFGMEYLMLTPEYRGKVDFLSFFITGLAFGWLFMTWNLTTYLLCADRFSFLATLRAPFTKFCLNNSIIPFIFTVIYFQATIRFQWHDEFVDGSMIFYNCLGFISGFIVLVFVLSGYFFFTNKDIYAFLHLGALTPRAGGRLLSSGKRIPTLWEIRSGATRWRVDTYLSERIRWRPVRSVAHYDYSILKKVFQQNHLNAALVQATGLLVLIILGFFMESKWFRIPTGATIFMLASLFTAIFGAITFWFRHWGTLAFLLTLLSLNYVTSKGYFNHRNQAYGLDYETKNKAVYDYAALERMCHPDSIANDKKNTTFILNKWLLKNKEPNRKKPKMVFLCVSGGGMRAAVWTMHTVQKLNQATNGRFLKQTNLITGASGGMLGAAYMREVYLRQEQGDLTASVQDPMLISRVSKDLLNPVVFAILSNDLFFPFKSFKSGKHMYSKDRGYMFEKTLNENCGGILDKTISEYKTAEQNAQVPMLFIHPFILNDARQAVISPQPVRYMMRADHNYKVARQLEIDAVDLGSLFADQDAGDLTLTSALRMNSTFPYILPSVVLPSQPQIEVMDAGIRDNYGMRTAARYIYNFKDWIRENTSGVVVVQVRCWAKVEHMEESDHKGVVGTILSPAGISAKITTMNDFENDNSMALTGATLGDDMLNIVHFIYTPVRSTDEASLNLHISQREKSDIMKAFYNDFNSQSLDRLVELLR